MGDFRTAIDHHTKSLTIRQAMLPPNHPAIAMCYDNLGTAYHNLGDYNAALQHLTKALNIRKAKLGENHPAVAKSHSNLGHVYRRILTLTQVEMVCGQNSCG